ncbi:hypothetical protein [Pleionea sp. CnH1-48]|uniref:hypothetical protein n=1 Tax=Pleionea sp. CnH1-48 TaxID=2954494 RepID=UPI002097C34D|nr:hypothetical protein [Pleionea sp. CnH1-48]MCO7226002.1 hypothetical protein [Pleionea sp. CnH1-48]
MRYWFIEGYDGPLKVFEKKVKFGYITDNQMRELLKALTAKASLDDDEIIGAYCKRNTKIANNLLIVTCNSSESHYTLTCGTNPFFMANVIEG